MLRTLLLAVAGFVPMFVTNGLLAAFVIGPLLEHRYQDIIASPGNFPLLIAGYLIIALAMVFLFNEVKLSTNWLQQGLTVGLLVGLLGFFGTHTVLTGYTSLDPFGFIVSGLFDSLGPTLGMLAIAYVGHRSRKARGLDEL